MPIVTQCPKCGKRLKAPDNQLGKEAKCPQCKKGFTIAPVNEGTPAADKVPSVAVTPVSIQPSVTPISSQPMWHVQTADGAHYGPVTKSDLDAWVTDGRLDADCQVLLDGWDQWKWAEEVYPELAKQPVGDAPVFGTAPQPTETFSGVARKGANVAMKGLRLGTSAVRERLTRVDKFTIWHLFDFKFQYYLTPWIIRAYWVLTLLTTSIYLVFLTVVLIFSFAPDVSFSTSTSQPSSGWTPGTVPSSPSEFSIRAIAVIARIVRYIAAVVVAIFAVLTVRIICEILIVIFNIATTLTNIERQTLRSDS